MSRRVQSNCETFDDFVQEVGPTYAKFSNTKTGIHHSKGDGALPLDGKIRSFSPIRESTCQILNCGEAVMTAMLYAIKVSSIESKLDSIFFSIIYSLELFLVCHIYFFSTCYFFICIDFVYLQGATTEIMMVRLLLPRI